MIKSAFKKSYISLKLMFKFSHDIYINIKYLYLLYL
jgi:hypothetical protein